VSPYPGSIRADVPWPTGASNAELQTDQEAAPRQEIPYHCPDGHVRVLILAAQIEPPDAWECNRCGRTAHREGAPADAVADFHAYNASIGRTQPKRGAEETTPWAQLMKRRTKAEGEVILAEAMERAKEARGGV
jgi:hypothetical protein